MIFISKGIIINNIKYMIKYFNLKEGVMNLAIGIIVLILIFKLLGFLIGMAFKLAIIAGILYLGYQIYQKYLADMF